ncbi:MAG: PDZ domain-containing protein [Bryobacteraceae bacterium]|nr:PDZ domain-containing protein [Bryobacteraceae bacterium]
MKHLLPALLFAVVTESGAAAELTRKADAGLLFGIAGDKLQVAQVRPGSNADRAGLKVGDVVLQVNGEAPAATRDFARSIYKRRAGDEVKVRVLREGQEVDLRLSYPERAMEPGAIHGQVLAGDHLRRTLVTAPARPGRHAALLWVAGSGCGSQESPDLSDPVAQLLHAFTAKHSMVTMRVEKTGVGDSEGPPCYSADAGLAQEVGGYVAALEALRKAPNVDPARVYLFGHSAGVLHAPLVAAGRGVAGIIAAGGSGAPYFDYHSAMRRREFELAGKPAAEIEAQMAITTRCLTALLKEHRSPDEIEKEMPDCRRRVRFDSPPVMVDDHARVDLQKAWDATAPVRVLLLYGSGDFVTSRAQTEALRDMINKPLRRAEMKVLPMDHGFLAYGKESEAWEAERGGKGGRLYEGVLQTVAEWMSQK